MAINGVGVMDHGTFREHSREIRIGVNVTQTEFSALQQKNSSYREVSFASLDRNSDNVINRRDFDRNPGSSGSQTGSTGGGGSSGSSIVSPDEITTVGGVNTSSNPATVASPAQNGDLEIVVLGSSSSRNGSGAMNPTAMTSQGFELVQVSGDSDRKIEVWARQSTGQGSVQIPGDGYDVGYSIHAVDASNGLQPSDVVASGSTSGTMSGSTVSEFNSSFSGNTSGTAIREIFFDDSVLVNNAGAGDIRHSNHSFGDGDGLASIVYGNGINFDENLATTNYDPAGRQSVEMIISFNKS